MPRAYIENSEAGTGAGAGAGTARAIRVGLWL